MNSFKYSLIVLTLSSGVVLAAESVSTALPSQEGANGNAQQKLKGAQNGPIVGSMIEDGREVPMRFRGVESKEQQARREQQAQKQREPESEEK